MAFIFLTALYWRKHCEQKPHRSTEKAQLESESFKILENDPSDFLYDKSSASSLISKNSVRSIRSPAGKPICTLKGSVAEGFESLLYKRKFEALSSTSYYLQTHSPSACSAQEDLITKGYDIDQLVTNLLNFSRIDMYSCRINTWAIGQIMQLLDHGYQDEVVKGLSRWSGIEIEIFGQEFIWRTWIDSKQPIITMMSNGYSALPSVLLNFLICLGAMNKRFALLLGENGLLQAHFIVSQQSIGGTDTESLTSRLQIIYSFVGMKTATQPILLPLQFRPFTGNELDLDVSKRDSVSYEQLRRTVWLQLPESFAQHRLSLQPLPYSHGLQILSSLQAYFTTLWNLNRINRKKTAFDGNSESPMHDVSGLLNPLPNHTSLQPIIQELTSHLQHYHRRIIADADIFSEVDPAIRCLKVLCVELQDYYADLYTFESELKFMRLKESGSLGAALDIYLEKLCPLSGLIIWMNRKDVQSGRNAELLSRSLRHIWEPEYISLTIAMLRLWPEDKANLFLDECACRTSSHSAARPYVRF